jgi:hypothetical protein
MSSLSWNHVIAPKVERAMDKGEAVFEVRADGHRFVSLLTIDATGDNTLVYMTRSDADRLIAKLQRARRSLHRRKARKRSVK